jgi:TRAP transporter 4TM/12TM fusion protein
MLFFGHLLQQGLTLTIRELIMTNKSKSEYFYKVLFWALCFIYVWMLIHYALFPWESRQRYGIIFLTLTMMIATLMAVRKKALLGIKGKSKTWLACILFLLSTGGGIYFWTQYMPLIYDRTGDLNQFDVLVSAVYIGLVILWTWNSSGYVIPTVTLAFISYGLFGHLLPTGNFFYHVQLSFPRFMEVSIAEMSGVFGGLNQIGATWVAIFAFFAGFVQGFGGLDYIIRIIYRVAGRWEKGMPQVAVLGSMAFGSLSGSAGANAISTGAFTIPTMKRFGMPSQKAAAIESVASSGGQIMPPILGAAAFVMCDFVDKHYWEILLASLLPSIIYFGSTMLSVYFLANRYIDPTRKVDLPPEFEKKMSLMDALEGIPIAAGLTALLVSFVVYKVNILLGGLCAILAFLIIRFMFEAIKAGGNVIFLWNFLKGIWEGTIKGATMMVPIGAMLGSLGIVVRVLTTTGLAEKLSYFMVTSFEGQTLSLLFLTMTICIVFGMAVTTVAAYILVATLAAPILIKAGVPELAAHFSVFYWAMLSAITPPVAAVCVITASIGNANFMKTCWEAMKLGSPKFILPFFFISQPAILSFVHKGIIPFIIASVGFVALSAGIQSGWGWWQQALLLALSAVILIFPHSSLVWVPVVVVLMVLPILWKRYSKTVTPEMIPEGIS